jgi:hypothetical protein
MTAPEAIDSGIASHLAARVMTVLRVFEESPLKREPPIER